MTEYRINPDWVKKQKRRILWADLFLAGAALFFIAIGSGYYYIMHKVMSITPGYDFENLSLTSRLIFLGCCVIVPIAAVISAYYYNRRQKRILDLVPEHNGRICPKCMLVMKKTDTAGSLRCPKCKAEWPDDEIVQYWEQLVLPMRESAMWLAEKQQKYSPHKSKRWFVRLAEMQAFAKRRPILWMCLFAVIIIPIYMAFIYRVDGNWYSVISQTIMILPYIFAFALIGRGMKQRRGKEAHCASCNYLKPPSGSADIPNCPECGHAWNEFGGTVYGTVSPKPWLVVPGVLLFIIPMFMPLIRISSTFSGIYAKAMPTSLLIPYVSGYGHFVDAGAWAEVNNRNLTQQQRDHLAELILNTRKEHDYLDTDNSTWLNTQIKNKTINASLINRFFDERLQLTLTGPDHAVVGDAVTFHLEGKNRSDGTGYRVMAIPDQLIQDDQIIPKNEILTGQWEDCFLFDSNTHGGTRSAPHQPRPFKLTFHSPGKHTIHVVIWFTGLPAMSYMAPMNVSRKADGSPVLPPRAVWSKKVELMRTIVVSEK